MDGYHRGGLMSRLGTTKRTALFALLTRVRMEQWPPPSMATSFVGLHTGRTVMGR